VQETGKQVIGDKDALPLVPKRKTSYHSSMIVPLDAQDILYGDFDTGSRMQEILLGRPGWWPQRIDALDVIQAAYFTGLSVHGREHVGVTGTWTAVAATIPEQWTDGAVRLAWNMRVLLDERAELNNLYRMVPLDERSYQTQIGTVDQEDGAVLTVSRPKNAWKLDLDRAVLARMAAVMEIVDRMDGEWRYFSSYRPDQDHRQGMLLYIDAYGQLLGRVMIGDRTDEEQSA